MPIAAIALIISMLLLDAFVRFYIPRNLRYKVSLRKALESLPDTPDNNDNDNEDKEESQ